MKKRCTILRTNIKRRLSGIKESPHATYTLFKRKRENAFLYQQRLCDYFDRDTGPSEEDEVYDDYDVNNKLILNEENILETLLEEKTLFKQQRIDDGLYYQTQIEFAYRSNYIDGNNLPREQIECLLNSNLLVTDSIVINIDFIVETLNHFNCFDYILENAKKPITVSMINKLQAMLKINTINSRKENADLPFVEIFKKEIGDFAKFFKQKSKEDLTRLLNEYNSIKKKTIRDIVDFHIIFTREFPEIYKLEKVVRLLVFKECLANNLVPLIIETSLHETLYDKEKSSDLIKKEMMDYYLFFQIKYQSLIRSLRLKGTYEEN